MTEARASQPARR
jgi:hypothetical protein